MEGKEIVLVHGAAHGAWCWYKVATQLREAGFKTTTLDMISAGTQDKINADNVATIGQNAKPLLDYLANNVSGQVVLVGHSIAGITMSYAMERYPSKISHAIFICAGMPANNQSFLTSVPSDMLPRLAAAQLFSNNFGNGPDAPPTSITLNLSVLPQNFYNLSPPADTTLALTLLDTEPYCNLAEVLSLTPENYGSVRRFYLQTDQDTVWGPDGQQYLINNNPPERAFFITGSDHSPFFSKPMETAAYIVEISDL